VPNDAPAFAVARPDGDAGSQSDGGRRHAGRGDAVAEVRDEMAMTRVTDAADAVKEKLDAGRLVREHPWPAIAAALVAGVALSATGDVALAVGTQAGPREHELRRASEEIGAPPNDQRA
jgi:hypothetical protein